VAHYVAHYVFGGFSMLDPQKWLISGRWFLSA
jgi:hypothetical protein